MMSLQDKAQEVTQREQHELDELFQQIHKSVERDDEELAHLDETIREAEEAKRKMEKPITN
jgi:galactokinase/mevalonate kinase-like predicted kinase